LIVAGKNKPIKEFNACKKQKPFLVLRKGTYENHKFS